jgi:hypothetical protein
LISAPGGWRKQMSFAEDQHPIGNLGPGHRTVNVEEVGG